MGGGQRRRGKKGMDKSELHVMIEMKKHVRKGI